MAQEPALTDIEVQTQMLTWVLAWRTLMLWRWCWASNTAMRSTETGGLNQDTEEAHRMHPSLPPFCTVCAACSI